MQLERRKLERGILNHRWRRRGMKKLDVRLQLKFEVDVHLQFSLRRMRRRRRRRRGMKKLDVHL